MDSDIGLGSRWATHFHPCRRGTTPGAAALFALLLSQYVESNFIGSQPGPAGAAYASGYCLSVSEAPLLTMTAGYRGSRKEVRKR